MPDTDGKLPLENYLSLRFCSIIAIALPGVFLLLWIASATLDGQWVFGQDSLSRMGISENALAAALFNFGCMFCGAMGILLGIGTAVNERGFNLYAGIAYAVGMAFLMMVGVFPMNQGSIHYIVASTFGVFMFITLIFSAITDYRQRWHPEIDVLLLALSVVFIAVLTFTFWEPLLVIFVMVWTVIHGIKMRLFGDAFPLSIKN